MTSPRDLPRRPRATPEMERELRQRFPIETMSPEEYAARHAAHIMEFSYGRLSYADPRLGEWIHRLQAILTDRDLVAACRKQYLTEAELARAIELDEREY